MTPSRNLIITGIPRSGTSYLCSILNKVHDTVVINEPLEVIQIMRNASGIPLSRYYDMVRERIARKEPISNKIADGEFIEDTNVVDTRSYYTPAVDADNFLLGTKNTLIYLNTLDRLERELPGATVVACVRHPYDTIASWASVSFPQVRNADPRFLLNYVDEESRKGINRILQIDELAKRYAMWWDYLAGIITGKSSRVMVVRYEDMVVDPMATIEAIYEKASFPVNMRHVLEASSPRSQRAHLSPDMVARINEFCSRTARMLGYGLEQTA